jgi:hypothetical protein
MTTETPARSPYDTHDRRIRDLEIKVASHEAVCAERYRGIREDIDHFSKVVSRVGFGLIAGMAAILAKMVFG